MNYSFYTFCAHKKLIYCKLRVAIIHFVYRLKLLGNRAILFYHDIAV